MNLVYLDQNGLSDLSLQNSENLLSEFSEAIKGRGLSLAIGFPHVYETAKATEKRRKRICHVLESLPWTQVTPLIRRMDAEVQNEFYRFVGAGTKQSVPIVGPIFKTLGFSTFGELLSFVRLNTKNADWLRKYIHESDQRMENLLRLADNNLEEERRALLARYAQTRLKDGMSSGLGIHFPPRSLDLDEFIEGFDWGRCPHMSFYTAYQHYRYRDKARMNLSGEIADSEHAVLGSVGCEFVQLDSHSSVIANQVVIHECPSLVRIYSSLRGILTDLKTAPTGASVSSPKKRLKELQ